MKKKIQLAIMVVLIMFLHACEKKETPDAALKVITQALKDNDLITFTKASLSQTLYDDMVKEFKDLPASSDQQVLASFDQILPLLKGDDAVNQIMAMIGPQLQTLRQSMSYVMENKQQLRGVFLQSFRDGYKSYNVKSNIEFSDSDGEMLDNLEKILGLLFDKVLVSDALSDETIKKIVTIIVNTVKELEISSVSELQVMGLENAIRKMSVVVVGVKNVIAVYGISIDDILDSVKASDVVENDKSATVKVDYMFLGQPFSFNLTMIQSDDRWILKE